MELKYFREFSLDGELGAGYVADGMPYTENDIRTLFPSAIEITEEEQNLYVTGLYIRDSETGKPVERLIAEPEQQIVTPPTDQNTADMWEAILALSVKIEALEGK